MRQIIEALDGKFINENQNRTIENSTLDDLFISSTMDDKNVRVIESFPHQTEEEIDENLPITPKRSMGSKEERKRASGRTKLERTGNRGRLRKILESREINS